MYIAHVICTAMFNADGVIGESPACAAWASLGAVSTSEGGFARVRAADGNGSADGLKVDCRQLVSIA
jgi:hypothetical protein